MRKNNRATEMERANAKNDRAENTLWHVLRTLLFRIVCECVCVQKRVFFFDNFAASTAAFIQLICECSMRIHNSCSISGSVQLSTLLCCFVSSVQFCHFALLLAYTVLRSIFFLPLLLLLALLLPLPFIVTMRCICHHIQYLP